MNNSKVTLPTFLLPSVICIALLATGYGTFRFFSKQTEDANVVHVSGRIEALETHISAATATRGKSVTVKEGYPVHAGQLIVTLDSGELEKKLGESGPALKAALAA